MELDAWQGIKLMSLVGFEFRGTRVLGLSVPGHRDFPEVNLRFYVRGKVSENWRRGVVFVKELLPRRAIAWMARRLYGEPRFAAEDSRASFITNHAFGYSVCRGRTLGYEVKHPPWRVLESCHVKVDCDLGRLYGKSFGLALKDPCSAFIADVSAVVVRWGRRIA